MYRIDFDDAAPATLPLLLKEQATQNGDAVFLIDREKRLTFASVYQQCRTLATGLSRLGVGPGDRVLLYLSNCREMVLSALAVNLLQAVWVPVSTDYTGEWLSDAILRTRSKVLITEQQFRARIELSGEDAPQLLLVNQPAENPELDFQTLLKLPPFEPDYPRMHYGDTCSIVWTSGTTGRSKGVMISHKGWLRPICKGSSVFFQSEPDDVILNVLPMHHAAAWNTSILRALVEGLPVVLEKSFSVKQFWTQVNKFGATQSFTLGAMHLFLWHAPKRANDADNTLRYLQAIPMPKALKAPFEQRFGLKLLGSGYGQSECMMVTTTAGVTRAIPDNSIGFAPEDIEVKIFDSNDREVPAGTVGEMRIKPGQPHIVCNGYFDQPEATAASWKGDWFCTGDLGYVDSDGAFFFSDRKKDAVRYAGRNISTLEVEGIVRQHAAVVDVAAYGIPSNELASEDELKIDVVLARDALLSFEDLAAFINRKAPYYFVPRYLEFVAALPYTPTHKAQKFLLRDKGVSEATWDLKQSGYVVKRP